MKKFNVPTLVWNGRKKLELKFPTSWKVSFAPMNGYRKPRITKNQIKNAIRNPVGTKSLQKIAKGKQEAVIVVDDMTRATPAYQVVPELLVELKAAGISDDHVRFIMGGGNHAAWYRDDFVKKLGEEIVEQYPVYNHNPFGNYEEVGKTTRGTPLIINAEYVSCDLRIGIGSVVPHCDAGFGGGAKLILPGISSIESAAHMHTLQSHNSLFEKTGTSWGQLSQNEIRADIEEAGEIVGIDMKIDALLNGIGDSAQIFAGDVHDEFRSAVACARDHYFTNGIPDEVDVLVANTYAKAIQASLAVSNWKHHVSKNGVMVLIAQAPGGQGTHFLQGKFGKKQFAHGYTNEKNPLKKLIVFSEYKTPDPLLPISDGEIIWLKNWGDVLREIESSFDHAPTVALLPNADIQCDERISTSSQTALN